MGKWFQATGAKILSGNGFCDIIKGTEEKDKPIARLGITGNERDRSFVFPKTLMYFGYITCREGREGWEGRGVQRRV